MQFKQQVQVQCQTSINGYYLLSIYNLHLNTFLSLFSKSIITDLRMYWIDSDEDYVTNLIMPVPVKSLNLIFDGFDIQILTVEVELDNDFIIDTNLSDELFCRVPPTYPVNDLINKIKQMDNRVVVRKHKSSISSLDDDAWNTKVME